MGRMMEALRQPAETAKPPMMIVETEAEIPEAEAIDEEIPFIEIGGGPPSRSAAAATTSTPPVRGATLRLPPVAGVRLQPLRPPSANPAQRVHADLIAYHQPDHPVSRQYSALFAQLAPEAPDGPAPVLLLTSVGPDSGTTSIALNLAICGCRQHQRSIIVLDANRPRPVAAAALGIQLAVGLDEVLLGKAALEKALVQTPVQDLRVLCATAATMAVVWPADALRWVLGWLRMNCDLVLAVAPAWEDNALLRNLTATADAVYVVADATEAKQPQVRVIARAAAQLGSRVGGLIVSQQPLAA
jgi:Mrp family chromosome partitioning ATPase